MMGVTQLTRILTLLALFGIYKGNGQVLESSHSGGALAVAGTTPYQVAILQIISNNFGAIEGKKFVCSGSLIESRWVLTAAQCVSNPNLRIILGVTNIRVYEPYYVNFDIGADDVIVHPKYNAEKVENDIALIRLPETVQYNSHVQSILLDSTSGDHVNETTFLSEWGRASPFTPLADYLRQTTTKVISNEKCQGHLTTPFFYIRCSHLCTSRELSMSEIGACAGDTGAPLVVFNVIENRPEQIGIVTKPPFACKGSEPTIYTKVNSYKKWIRSFLGGAEEEHDEHVHHCDTKVPH